MNIEPRVTFTDLLRGRKFEDAQVPTEPGPVLWPKSLTYRSPTGCGLAIYKDISGIPCRHHVNSLQTKKRAS